MTTLNHLGESIALISETTVQGVFFGINFSLYFLCTQLCYRQYHEAPSHERRKHVFSFLYNSLMVFAALLELSADGEYMRVLFIELGGIPSKIRVFEANVSNTYIPILLVLVISFIIPTLNSLMQVSRFVSVALINDETFIGVAYMGHLGNITLQTSCHHFSPVSHDFFSM
jgi:hypothetical protein